MTVVITFHLAVSGTSISPVDCDCDQDPICPSLPLTTAQGHVSYSQNLVSYHMHVANKILSKLYDCDIHFNMTHCSRVIEIFPVYPQAIGGNNQMSWSSKMVLSTIQYCLSMKNDHSGYGSLKVYFSILLSVHTAHGAQFLSWFTGGVYSLYFLL